LTLAEVTAGTIVNSLHFVGISLDNYPKLRVWLENLNQRSAWVKSLPTQEAMERFKASRSGT
jgi:glutathione S-transferase